MIKKVGKKYVVRSESTGRVFGQYDTIAAAKKRLRQMEFFKHLKGSPALKKTLRKKSLLKRKN